MGFGEGAWGWGGLYAEPVLAWGWGKLGHGIPGYRRDGRLLYTAPQHVQNKPVSRNFRANRPHLGSKAITWISWLMRPSL